MNVYVVVDDDSGDIYTFLSKKNAITFMYNKCKNWGAVLSISKNGNYVLLRDMLKTDEDVLAFLIDCSDKELNDVFYCYWHYVETIPEDEQKKYKKRKWCI